MIKFAGSIDIVKPKESEQQNNHLVKKMCSLAPRNVSVIKSKRKSNLKERTPLCNWIMPAQREGYIRAGKYDLL